MSDVYKNMAEHIDTDIIAYINVTQTSHMKKVGWGIKNKAESP